MSAHERLDSPVTPLRSDVWAANAAHSSVRYSLQVEAEPDSLCRVLNLFALQFLTPHQVQMRQQDDLLNLEIGVAGLSWHRAQVIAEKLRNLVSVCSVELQSADSAWGDTAQAATCPARAACRVLSQWCGQRISCQRAWAAASDRSGQ